MYDCINSHSRTSVWTTFFSTLLSLKYVVHSVSTPLHLYFTLLYWLVRVILSGQINREEGEETEVWDYSYNYCQSSVINWRYQINQVS